MYGECTLPLKDIEEHLHRGSEELFLENLFKREGHPILIIANAILVERIKSESLFEQLKGEI